MAYGTPVGPLHRESTDPAERRVAKRKALLTHADVMISAQQQLPGHAIDISSGGIGLICPVPLNHGQEIVIRLALAVCGTERHMEITGCVCFCLSISVGQFRVGLQFVHLDDDTAEFIAAVCA
jgi:hypothetical protein